MFTSLLISLLENPPPPSSRGSDGNRSQGRGAETAEAEMQQIFCVSIIIVGGTAALSSSDEPQCSETCFIRGNSLETVAGTGNTDMQVLVPTASVRDHCHPLSFLLPCVLSHGIGLPGQQATLPEFPWIASVLCTSL